MNVTARPHGRRARWHLVLTRTRTSRARGTRGEFGDNG